MANPFNYISALAGLIHTGEWNKTAEAVDTLAKNPVPADLAELGEYRRRLHETLLAARAARAHLLADLARLQASHTYQNGTSVPERSSERGSGGHTA